MFYYKVYGLIFRSNIEMPQLLDAPTPCNADADIFLGNVPEYVIHRGDEVPAEDNGDSIWFHNTKAYFYATASQIIVQPKENQVISDIIPFIQGYCFALLFRKRGLHAIHCSALRCEKGAVLIAGYSGSGKSTVSDRLFQEGYRLMADDVAILRVEDNRLMVYPAFPIRKMCRDALDRENYDTSELEYIDEERDKFAIRCDEIFDENPAELHRMIILKKKKDGSVQVNHPIAGDALEEFIESLFLMGTFSYLKFPPDQMMSALEVVSHLNELYTITRPLGVDTLDEVYNEVKKILNVCHK